MYELDVAATQAINSLAGKSGVLDHCMIWISAIGVPILIVAVAIQWWRKDDRRHVRHVLLATGLSFLLGLALNQFILLFVQRLRPYATGVTHLLIAKSTDPSFPSDHATASAAIAFAFMLHGMRRARPVLSRRSPRRDGLPHLHRHPLRERCAGWRCNGIRRGCARACILPGRHRRGSDGHRHFLSTRSGDVSHAVPILS